MKNLLNTRIKQTFYFEMTDTFGGETNYSWLHRFIVHSKSIRGALQKLSKETGYHYKNKGGEMWQARKACVAVYTVGEYDEPSADWVSKAKTL